MKYDCDHHSNLICLITCLIILYVLTSTSILSPNYSHNSFLAGAGDASGDVSAVLNSGGTTSGQFTNLVTSDGSGQADQVNQVVKLNEELTTDIKDLSKDVAKEYRLSLDGFHVDVEAMLNNVDVEMLKVVDKISLGLRKMDFEKVQTDVTRDGVNFGMDEFVKDFVKGGFGCFGIGLNEIVTKSTILILKFEFEINWEPS